MTIRWIRHLEEERVTHSPEDMAGIEEECLKMRVCVVIGEQALFPQKTGRENSFTVSINRNGDWTYQSINSSIAEMTDSVMIV